MPFFINEDQRISINLSDFANYIIETDMVTFGKDKRSTFINIVIKNFKDEAKSTITTSSEAYRAEIEEILCKKDINIDSKEYKRIVDSLAEHYIENIVRHNDKKGNTYKVRLNKDNTEYLTRKSLDSDYYDNSIGAYVNALLEEYSRLSYKEREAIVYKDNFELINNAIRDKKILKIDFAWGKTKKIKPYKLSADRQQMYYYLVGYDKDSKENVSCRVNYIEKITCLKENSSLTLEDKKSIERDLSEKGIQFMTGVASEVKIRLTDRGKDMYNRILHLRPLFREIIDEDIYIFNCNCMQIEFYFLKFGKEAEIISPLELREKFKNTYLEAYELYKD